MIPDLRPHGLTDTAARRTCRALLVPLLVLSAAWLAACDKVPLTAPSGTTIHLFTNAQVLPINGTAEITASVLETGGNPVQNGTVVTFMTSLGTVTPTEAKTTDGKVTVIFQAGSQSGTAVVNAFSGPSSTNSTSTGTGGTPGATTSGTGVTIVIGAAAATTVVATASPSSVSQLGGSSTISAAVLDSNNNALPGVPVTFSTDQGTLSPVAAVTNSSGIASTTLTTNQTATVTVTAGTKTATAKVTAVAVPTITITGPTTTPTAGLTATFTLNVTAGTGSAPIRNVYIDFGDGTSVSLGAASGTVSVPHVYTGSGTFTVTAIASDASGQNTSMSIPIVVFPAVPFTLTVTASSGRVGAPVTMTAVPNTGAPSIISYTWDFGDGTVPVTTTIGTVSHIYTSLPSGFVSFPFVISVTAVGADGRTGIGSTSVTISQ
jgi:large repetitive protein